MSPMITSLVRRERVATSVPWNATNHVILWRGWRGISYSIALWEIWEGRRKQRCWGSLCHVFKIRPLPWKKLRSRRNFPVSIVIHRKTNIACFGCSIWTPALLHFRSLQTQMLHDSALDCCLRRSLKKNSPLL